ncbi:hypothetical protein HWB19_gp024 [Cronobacter phage vB_CsaP_009]|uniref:Uncharacterized protein n=1 Tax=Cronobacter phage vB_CsaP_009 TaxID=2699738 RepID=A0A679FL63_9CAUD|nr:hypothetical protein HWB19_gp024 [Cronobacter phage vB_CsaP_009]BBU72670.1 hypothetical protein [Cronobacter phage vB_CsaP_009]
MFSSKKSLSSILSSFTKVRDDLVLFLSENKENITTAEKELKTMKQEQAGAEKALTAVKAITGEEIISSK